MEMKINGLGTFIQKGSHIFRSHAELQFGEGTGETFLAIGLNPGSSQLIDPVQWGKLLSSQNQPITGEIKLDKTMLHIKEIVLAAKPDFQGKVVINNLMNYRSGNMAEALAAYKDLKVRGGYPELETDFDEVLRKYANSSFVWLGWSLRSDSILNSRKKEVLNAINILGKRIVAKHYKEDFSSPHVWHFCPLLHKNAQMYKIYIVPILQGALCRTEESKA
jgi:hypothetical protein